MLRTKFAAAQNCGPWNSYKVGAIEEHLSPCVLLSGALEEPGSVLVRSCARSQRKKIKETKKKTHSQQK